MARQCCFLDLPVETQRQIIGHMSRKDLFVFQRLSSHCFSLANDEIYRILDLNLANSNDDNLFATSSYASDALQTLNASNYEYARHVKSFRLGVQDGANGNIANAFSNSDDLLMTRLLWDMKSDSSRFLNTAVLLMIRKATSIETFQWDAPIEMSGTVYQALHKITSLKHLRVRLDVSPSPRMVLRQGTPGPPPMYATPAGLQQTQSVSNPLQSVPPLPSATNPGLPRVNSKRKKTVGGGGSNYWANPRMFSGFKHLSTLALLGLSNLDCLKEVAECIKASSATIKSLTVTLSTDLARKAQKPTPINPDLDEASDLETEDEDSMNSAANGSQAASQANEADIRKEKLAQESILARIFDLQSVALEGKKLDKNLSLSEIPSFSEHDANIINKRLRNFMNALMYMPQASDTYPCLALNRLEHFKMIREVADLYISSHDLQGKMPKKSSTKTLKKSASSSKPLNPLASEFKQSGESGPLLSNLQGWDTAFLSLPNQATASSQAPGISMPSNVGQDNLYSANGASSSANNSASSISVLKDEFNHKLWQQFVKSELELLDLKGGTELPYAYPPLPLPVQNANGASIAKSKPPNDKTPSTSKVSAVTDSNGQSDVPTKSPQAATQPFFAAASTSEPCDDAMDIDMEHPDENTQELGDDQEMLSEIEETTPPTPRKRTKFETTASCIAIPNKQDASVSLASLQNKPHDAAGTSSEDVMQNYIRRSHGLQLESLSLEWVPLKASILARALDLKVLKRLTLLEVGEQGTFWTLLERLQSTSPEISFKSIHTDSVSPSFLKFVIAFDGLEELFMHERSAKQGEDSTTANAVSITIIRKLALKKHASTLERLMIKNERNDLWDVDTKTLQTLALRAPKLRELAISMTMRTYHILMQYFGAFKNLYALHLLNLRTGDRGVAMQSESANFAVDSLCHFSDMKIKYLAIGNYAVLLQSKPSLKSMKDYLGVDVGRQKDRKGKGKATLRSSYDQDGDDSASDEAEEALAGIRGGQAKTRLHADIYRLGHVKIFSQQLRLGKIMTECRDLAR
ncbi:hypothetical protein ACLMJK_007390 [Lecanora helva]